MRGMRLLPCLGLAFLLQGCGTLYSAYKVIDVDGVRPEQAMACNDYACLAELPDTDIVCGHILADDSGEYIFRFQERESRGWAFARFLGHTAGFFIAGAIGGDGFGALEAAAYYLYAVDGPSEAIIELYGDADFIAWVRFDPEGNVLAFQPGPRLANALGRTPEMFGHRCPENEDIVAEIESSPTKPSANEAIGSVGI